MFVTLNNHMIILLIIIKSCSQSQESEDLLLEGEEFILSTPVTVKVRTGPSQAKYGPYDLVYFGEEVILDDSHR